MCASTRNSRDIKSYPYEVPICFKTLFSPLIWKLGNAQKPYLPCSKKFQTLALDTLGFSEHLCTINTHLLCIFEFFKNTIEFWPNMHRTHPFLLIALPLFSFSPCKLTKRRDLPCPLSQQPRHCRNPFSLCLFWLELKKDRSPRQNSLPA
jgi:hypothetical protein